MNEILWITKYKATTLASWLPTVNSIDNATQHILNIIHHRTRAVEEKMTLTPISLRNPV